MQIGQRQLNLWLTEDQALEEAIIFEMLRLFRGDTRRVMQQNPSGEYGVLHSGALTLGDLRRHLRGDISASIYLLDENARCYTLCFDIDIPKIEIPLNAEEREKKKKSEFLPIVNQIFHHIKSTYGVPDRCFLLEDTGGRGYHIWLFFEEPQPANSVIIFAQQVKRNLGIDNLEFFPHKAQHGPSGYSKSNVRLPLGLNRKYPGSRSVFLDLRNNEKIQFPQMAKYLTNISFVSGDIIEKAKSLTTDEVKLTLKRVESSPNETHQIHKTKPHIGNVGNMLFLCPALSRLEAKAKSDGHLKHHERLALALTLRHCANGENRLQEIIKYCMDYSATETQRHIDSLAQYLPISCRRLQSPEYYVCTGWCCPQMERANEEGQSPTPLWFAGLWKPREDIKTDISDRPLIEAVASIGNLYKAWEQAKIQAKERDIFEDVQAYETFEENLWPNLYVLRAEILLGDWRHQPFRAVEAPKKKDDPENMRPMCWASPWDSVVAFAVLNVIGPSIDSTFHENSLGNRLALGPKANGQVFEDWPKQNRYREIRREGFSEYGEGYFYILADIARFYEYVKHDRLMTLLKTRGVNDQKVLNIVQQFLEAEWLLNDFPINKKSSDGILIGIPQGPALSAFLANLYLDELDYWLEKRAVDFVRYVDDMSILCEGKKDSESIINELKILLKRRFSLDLSDDPKKTLGPFPVNDTAPIKDWIRDARYELIKYSRLAGSLAPAEKNEMRTALELISGARLKQKEDLDRFIKYLGFYIAATERLNQPEIQKGVYALAFYILNEQRPRHNATCIALRALIKACSDFGEDAWIELNKLLASRQDEYIRIILAQEARKFLEEHELGQKLYKELLKTLEEQASSSSMVAAAAAICCLVVVGEMSSDGKLNLLHRYLGEDSYIRPRAAILLSRLGELSSTTAARVIPEDGDEANILLFAIRHQQSKDIVNSIANILPQVVIGHHAAPSLLFASILTNSENGMKACLEFSFLNSPEILRHIYFYIAAKYIEMIVTGEIKDVDINAAIKTAVSERLLTLAKQIYDLGRFAKVVSQIPEIEDLLESIDTNHVGTASTSMLPTMDEVTLGEPLISINSRVWLHEANLPDGSSIYHEVISDSELQRSGQDIESLLDILNVLKKGNVLLIDKTERMQQQGNKYVLTVTAKDRGWQTIADLIHKSESLDSEQRADVLKKTATLVENAKRQLNEYNLPLELLPVPSCHNVVINNNGEVRFRNIIPSISGSRYYIGLSKKPLDIPSENWVVYVLGLFFFEIVTSTCVVSAILSSSRRQLLAECPQCDVAGALFTGILGKATAKQPDSRYDNIELLLKDVNEWCNLEAALSLKNPGKPLKERVRRLWHIELGLERRMHVFAKEHHNLLQAAFELSKYILEELEEGGELEDAWLRPNIKELFIHPPSRALHVAAIQSLNLANTLERQWQELMNTLDIPRKSASSSWIRFAVAAIEIEAARRSLCLHTQETLYSICEGFCKDISVAFAEGQKVDIKWSDAQKTRYSDTVLMIRENALKEASDSIYRWFKQEPFPDPQWPQDFIAMAILLLIAKEGLIFDLSHSGSIKLGPEPNFKLGEGHSQIIERLFILHKLNFLWLDMTLKKIEFLEQESRQTLSSCVFLNQLGIGKRQFGKLPGSPFQQLYTHQLAKLDLATVLGFHGQEIFASRISLLPFPKLSFYHVEGCPFSVDLVEKDGGSFKVAALSLPPVVRKVKDDEIYPILHMPRQSKYHQCVLLTIKCFFGRHAFLLLLSIFSYLWQVYSRKAGLIPNSAWISALDGWFSSFGISIFLFYYVKISIQRIRQIKRTSEVTH